MTAAGTSASTPIVVGSVAPDFTLASTSGSMVTLSSLRGQKPVLLAFFPLAFTSVCTAELCAFGDDFDAFTSANIEILPISVDAQPSLKEYRNKYAMKVELLSDLKREASRAYGVLNEDTFIARRSYFLIDPTGVVRWAHVEEQNRDSRTNAEILEAIANVMQ